jgi:hypothetical protein
MSSGNAAEKNSFIDGQTAVFFDRGVGVIHIENGSTETAQVSFDPDVGLEIHTYDGAHDLGMQFALSSEAANFIFEKFGLVKKEAPKSDVQKAIHIPPFFN